MLPTWLHRHLDTFIYPQKSRYTTRHHTHHHIAFICKGRKVLATGQNRLADIGRAKMQHAEMDAIRELGDVASLRGAWLFVIRLGANETYLLNSKPCAACQHVIEKCVRTYKLRGVKYS